MDKKNTSVIRIKPHHNIHVLDNNTNVTRVEVGPKTYTRAEHEIVVFGPRPMIMVPPRSYCIIENPVRRDDEGNVIYESDSGQVILSHGDQEVRFHGPPFPLYPGEVLAKEVGPLDVVEQNTALHLVAKRDFIDENETERKAGQEWLFTGPGTYIPRVEVEVKDKVYATVIGSNAALRLKAKEELVDIYKTPRKAGEEWLIRESGSYIPDVNEVIVGMVEAQVLTEKKALHILALRTFKDVYGIQRKAGEEWLVTIKDTETHIIDVNEQLVGEVPLMTLTSLQYCVVLDPKIDGKNHLGKRQLRKGEDSFFLLPGESLENGIQDVYVLDSDEALLLKTNEPYVEVTPDGKETKKMPGDKWMINGPMDYVPPIQVEVLERRKAIPLDENEGIYVRDTTTGKVRLIKGESYMLNPQEELWEKDLPENVEALLQTEMSRDRKASKSKSGRERDRSRAVTYRIPHNSAVQVYDYKAKTSRVVFGPDLVILAPEEHFTVLSLSGNVPKRPHVIKALALLLGPDFMTDTVTVETADHARLSLRVSYNWYFDLDQDNEEDRIKPFQVPDFVGTTCKAIASKIRGIVATHGFDAFHKRSSDIIRAAVFGTDEDGNIKSSYRFEENNLVISGIDIQSVEPVDQKTRDALQKSVQLAIEITTKSQEATARHEAERQEQIARGKLERQKIDDESEAERAKKKLLQLQAESATVESTGQATAEAQARSQASLIEGQALVKQAQLKAEAETIKAQSDLQYTKEKHREEIEHQKSLNDIEVEKQRMLSEIETKKFSDIVNAIGADTIKAMAQAGPEMQAKLLQGLGLSGYLITDGKSPINLFNTAQGMIAQPTQQLPSTQQPRKEQEDFDSDDDF